MAKQKARLADGGLIERGETLQFTFDGKRYTGHPGDSLASALLANGVKLFGRSFKYHRPRGVLTAGWHEPNALVELREGRRREPNIPAPVIELFDGLKAASQNRWPSLRLDLLSLNGLLSPILVAGFYYKTFMWPASFWEPVYERFIRRAAGLGRSAIEADPDRYEKAYAHCDVLVVGAGPSGLLAAEAAAEAGARVLLCDDDHRPGGALLSERVALNGQPGHAWAAALAERLADNPKVRVFSRTQVFGYYDHDTLGAIERVADHRPQPDEGEPRQRLWRIAAKRVILSPGAEERPLVFAGNDLPGVMLASAARAYVNRYAVRPGKRAVIAGNNDDIYRTAADLAAAGVEIAAVVDLREGGQAAPAAERVFAGADIVKATGGQSLKAVDVAPGDGGSLERIGCDLLCIAGGWNPSVHLSSQTGVKPVWDEEKVCFLPVGNPHQNYRCSGAMAGQFDLETAMADGREAGLEAAAALDFVTPSLDPLPSTGERLIAGAGAKARFWIKKGAGKAFVDFQNDVTDKDVALAAREGYRSVEHLKRYTTLGMATDQGKTSNINGLAILADLLGKDIPEVGTTTFRPPYTPLAVGALAGHARQSTWRPTRYTPLHAWNERMGATFKEAGFWMRAEAYPKAGESLHDAINREVEAVRAGVGLCDVSTLGKIDIQGADAPEFLNRVYSNAFKKLPVGKARYGLMLREDGIVEDDGTTSRLAEDRFFMTTTTGHAGPSMANLEFYHQALWPQLDVTMTSVSDQWAGLALAGPKSRAVLEKLLPGEDLSNTALPFLGVKDVEVDGIVLRIFRISFSGELGFEINVAADYAESLADALMALGEEFAIVPYGLEALDVMRIEKGFVTHNELNGQVTAEDAGLGWMMSKKKDFNYIGRALANREGLQDPEREQLVGLRPVDRRTRIKAGSHVIAKGDAAVAANDQGHVTSACYSPTLGMPLALALVKRGPERHGEIVRAVDLLSDSEVEAEIVPFVFHDPDGEKLRG